VPLLSDRYLKELVAAFPHDVPVYNLSIEGKLASAIACCAMQKERYGLWIGMVNVRKDLQLIEYLDWKIVKRAKSEGFKKLYLGACDAGPAQYKSKFNSLLEPFWTLNKRTRCTRSILHTISFGVDKVSLRCVVVLRLFRGCIDKRSQQTVFYIEIFIRR